METVSLDSPFLSDEKPIEIIETMIEKHKKIIVEAPTGVGKTYTFIDLAKKSTGNTIFAVPNVANVLQISKEYDVLGVSGDKEIPDDLWKNNNVVVSTYDKSWGFLKRSFNDLTVILDEAHNLQSQANFRSDAIVGIKKLAEKADKAVFLSATINHLQHDLYGKVLRFKPTNPKCIIGKSKILTSGKHSNREVGFDLIKVKTSEGKKCLVKMNSKSGLTQLQEKLKTLGITSAILTSDNKNKSNVMKKILEDQELPEDYQVILCTSLLDAGVNLKSLDVIIDIENGDPNAIKQLSARPREKLEEHYVIIKGKKKEAIPKQPYTRKLVEQAIQRRIWTAEKIKKDLNFFSKNSTEETQNYLRYKFSLVQDSIDEEFFVKSDDNKNFYIDIEALRNSEYEKYYKSLQNNPELLKDELEAYGLSITIEEYQLNKSGSFKKSDKIEFSEEAVKNELSEYLKTLQGIKEQEFALECHLSKDSENLFSNNKFSNNIKVPYSLFDTFGMYMALGFQYRLTYELMMKTYLSKQKRKKIKNYMLYYVYSKLINEPRILKDKGYKSFKLLYDLYGTENEKEVSVEDENKTLKAYIRILGKKYSKHKLSTRGGELAILESKSRKVDGKTDHYKISKGFHTAGSILETFEIKTDSYVQEFQALLDKKVSSKKIDLNIDNLDIALRPENILNDPFDEEEKVHFSNSFKRWMLSTNGYDGGTFIPSPYFPEDIISQENIEEPANKREAKPLKIENLETLES